MKNLCWFLWIIILVSACRGGNTGDSPEIPDSNSYASGFEIRREGEFTLLMVHDPWQNSRDVSFSYVLADAGTDIPDSLAGLTQIQVPVERVVALSTTHLAMVEALGRSGTICGVSGKNLVYSRALAHRIQLGEVRDVGYEEGLNYESIVSMDPDVLFIYGIESSARLISDRLTGLGVPVVYCGEYLESHPLGKAEWIRFFACFYGMEREADLFFNQVDSAYHALSELVPGTADRPAVLTGLPWNDTWFMSGGKSFAATLIRDAGGAFLWNDDRSQEAIPMDLESVFLRAIEAEVWINPGAAGSLAEIEATDERLGSLPVVRSGEVYNNNARVGPSGANDYWESATVRPDLVLADLIKVFHPGLLTDHPFTYYRKLK
jgi:iron complex transport system substrate-binding protein